MTLPTGWIAVPLDPDGGLPQAATLPAPDHDLRVVLVATAPDLAAALSAPPDRVVWSSRDALDRRSAVRPTAGPDIIAPGLDVRDVRTVAADTALAALTAAPGETLSPAEVRVVLLVLAGRIVLAAHPARPGRALPVSDAPGGGRLRGHLWVDEVTVAAGSLVAAGRTEARIGVGWRPLGAGLGAVAGRPAPMSPEDCYGRLV